MSVPQNNVVYPNSNEHVFEKKKSQTLNKYSDRLSTVGLGGASWSPFPTHYVKREEPPVFAKWVPPGGDVAAGLVAELAIAVLACHITP